MSLPGILSDAQLIDDALTTTIGEDWLQGRTAYGGASAAIALAAVKASLDDLPPLRSAQIAFVGPLAGEVTARPLLLRRGKNSAFVRCDVSGEAGLGLTALFLFMASRPSSIASAPPTMPAVEGPEARPAEDSAQQPGFMRNLDRAYERDPKGGFLRWARLKERTGLDPEVELIAIADALPPAAMSLATQWGPISTTTWQLNMLTDSPQCEDGWWLLQADTLHAAEGNSSQSMTIWNREGTPVATAMQSVALFI